MSKYGNEGPITQVEYDCAGSQTRKKVRPGCNVSNDNTIWSVIARICTHLTKASTLGSMSTLPDKGACLHCCRLVKLLYVSRSDIQRR